jgi:hypothetical protein
MPSQRLRIAPLPVQVDCLLDSLIVSKHYVPDTAHRVEFCDELPLQLQLHARHVRHGAWRAWTDGLRIWFVVARLIPEASRDLNWHALQVSFIDMDGRLASCAVWVQSGDGRWILYDANPPRYDESGPTSCLLPNARHGSRVRP